MKKEVVIKLFLMSILFVFLVSGIFAVNLGECDVVARGACDNTPTNGYILMGLSASTNAHGELATEENYDYVLCCNIGSGDSTCTGGILPNKVVGLSSSTNAHAESPQQDNYATDVCYEDFVCIGTTSVCGTTGTDAEDYPLEVLSLSADTNAHIDPYDSVDFTTNICCGGPSVSALSCEITDAEWNLESAIEGQKVYLQVTGSGSECDGQSVSFQVREVDIGSYTNASIQPVNVAFNNDVAIGVWNAEYVDDGLLGGGPEYDFVATVVSNEQSAQSSEPKLTVTEFSEDYCATVTECGGYLNEGECVSDLCGQAELSGEGLIDCDAEDIICGCIWNSETTGCEFGWNEIDDCGTPETGCNYGCTLCESDTTGFYCNLGATCPSGETPIGNNNGTCDFGIDGCLSDDCVDGNRDTCASPYYCSSGKCFSVEGPPLSLGTCKISQTIDKDCDEEPVGYKTITWTGVWTGEGACGTACQNCEEGGQSTIPCPAQVQLPFFDYIQIIIAVGVIVVIYISLIIKRKILKKIKKKVSKRKTKKKKRK